MKEITINVLQGDCIDRMKALSDKSIGAVICDPPYGAHFDATGSYTEMTGHCEFWTPVVGGRTRGYMDVDVDDTINWLKEWLKEAHRILQKGGVIKVFSSTRMYHNVARTMELMDFSQISLQGWIFRNGIPKGARIDQNIERFHPNKIGEVENWRGYHTSLKPCWEVVVVGIKQ